MFGLPAGLPAIRPSSTRSMAPEFSHRGNCVRFTKPLFRLRFIHCTMAFLFSFTIFLVLPLSVNYVQKSRKKMLIEVLYYQVITINKHMFSLLHYQLHNSADIAISWTNRLSMFSNVFCFYTTAFPC